MAADYVYSFKRFYDPLERTEHLHRFENAKVLGLSELRWRALEGKTPFPYDVEVPGLRVVFEFAPFGELIKRSLAGQLMMWGFSWGAPEPDGPERLALMHQANKLMLAYMPCMAHNHAIVTDLLQPGVRGPLRHAFNSDWFRWADVGGQAGLGRPALSTA